MNIQKKSLGYLEGWLSAIINLLLFFLKYWVGVKADSVAMKADAWHTLSDTLTSVVVILGFWMASKKADDEHPFGHGRAESVGAVIIGTLLFMVGSGFLIESVRRLIDRQGVHFTSIAILIFLISVVVKEAMASFSIWAGKKIDSHSLIADGWHHRSDAIASGLIVLGAVLGGHIWWIDGVAGIFVSLLIYYATYSILKNATSSLIGEKHENAIEDRINTLVHRISNGASDIHHLHVHKYGDNIELTFHIFFPEQMHLKKAHHIANEIERAIRDEMRMEATIHIEPENAKQDV